MASKKRESPLPPPRSHRITLGKAIEFVRLYRRHKGPAAEDGGFFWAEPVRKMLARKGVVGLRYYHGLDENGGYHIILVGVDERGRDVVRQVAGASPSPKGTKAAKAMLAAESTDDDILQEHFPCPPFCPPEGPLA